MTGESTGVRDLVEVRVTADVPVRAVRFADRLEIRLGKASPVVLVVERAAFYEFADAINNNEFGVNEAALRRQNLEG